MIHHNPIYALGIVAHPDDESFLFGGTSLKFAAEGKQTGVVCATHGEKGYDRLKRNLTENEMAAIRTDELKTACNMLHCSCVDFLDYSDGKLDQANFDELVNTLVGKIDYYQPEIILTFGPEGITGHKDHIVIGKASVAAAGKSQHRTKEIWLASIPASQIESFREHSQKRKVHFSHFQKQELVGVADDKLVKIDIRPYATQKNQAIVAHQSQYLPELVWDFFMEYECFEVSKLA